MDCIQMRLVEIAKEVLEIEKQAALFEQFRALAIELFPSLQHDWKRIQEEAP